MLCPFIEINTHIKNNNNKVVEKVRIVCLMLLCACVPKRVCVFVLTLGDYIAPKIIIEK